MNPVEHARAVRACRDELKESGALSMHDTPNARLPLRTRLRQRQAPSENFLDAGQSYRGLSDARHTLDRFEQIQHRRLMAGGIDRARSALGGVAGGMRAWRRTTTSGARQAYMRSRRVRAR